MARDLFDLLNTDEFGVSVFDAASVLSYVSTGEAGKRMLIQLVNYADRPAEQIKLWVYENFESVRLYTPDGAPVDLTPKHSGGRIEFTVNRLPVCGALLLQ